MNIYAVIQRIKFKPILTNLQPFRISTDVEDPPKAKTSFLFFKNDRM